MKKINKINKFNKLLILLSLISIILITLYFIKFHNGLSENQTIWGAFGDYLSGIFSSLAFIILLYTLYLQKKEFFLTTYNLKKSYKLNKIEYKRKEIILIIDLIETDIQRNKDNYEKNKKFMDPSINFNKLFYELILCLEKLKIIDPETLLIDYYKRKYKNFNKYIFRNLDKETKKFFEF